MTAEVGCPPAGWRNDGTAEEEDTALDRYLLKNIIIIILALMNLFLLAALVTRNSMESASRDRMEQQLVELFAADGIALEQSTISRESAPAPQSMSRDTELERRAAEFFLGQPLQREDQGGGIHAYNGARGVALFREDGSFDVAGSLATERAEELCRSFCKTFSCEEPIFTEEGETAGATAVCQYNGKAVINAAVTFRLERGTLQTVSGILLPESGTELVPEQPLLTASAALTEFQKMRRETGAVVSAVTEMKLCYRLQSSASNPMSLVPVWCIATDTAKYYVNCITAAVTTG